MRHLDWIGLFCGVIGAYLVASNTPLSKFGWLFFLVSSLALTAYTLYRREFRMSVLQIVFVGSNVLGIYRYLISPSL